MNVVILQGFLGADPELRFTPGGKAVTNMRIATNERWTGKDGQAQERVEWHRIVCWQKLAENCGEYLSKGSPVLVRGKIQSRKWTDRDGKERTSFEILASEVKFLGGRPKGGQASGSEASAPSSESGEDSSVADYGPPPVGDDGVPF